MTWQEKADGLNKQEAVFMSYLVDRRGKSLDRSENPLGRPPGTTSK